MVKKEVGNKIHKNNKYILTGNNAEFANFVKSTIEFIDNFKDRIQTKEDVMDVAGRLSFNFASKVAPTDTSWDPESASFSKSVKFEGADIVIENFKDSYNIFWEIWDKFQNPDYSNEDKDVEKFKNKLSKLRKNLEQILNKIK